MIEIQYKNKKVKTDPHYLLVYNYMIGDADGNTTEEVELSINNPYIERYVKLINSLKPTKGTWGISLDSDTLETVFDEKQINEDDYYFLLTMMFEGGYDEDIDHSKNPYATVDDEYNYSYEFHDGVRSETEYSFLTFQGAELFYINENGEKLKTKFV